MFFSVRSRHQDADVLTDQFRDGITKDSFRGRVERLDNATLVDCDNTFDRSLENGPEPFRRLATRLPDLFHRVECSRQAPNGARSKYQAAPTCARYSVGDWPRSFLNTRL